MKNIRTLTLVALFLALSLSSMAQKIHYGIKAGANFAVQSEIADYFQNNNIRTGLHLGVFSNYSVNNQIQLQLEANYDQKGGKSDIYIAKYDYVSVPLLFKYSLGKSDQTALRFNVNAGPYAAFLLKSEIEKNEETTDLSEQTENFEAGAILGFGMKYPVGKNNLILDLRLGLGLTDFDKTNSEPNNKYIGISLGYEL